MPTLGELIVAEGICTLQQIDEAVRSQVIFGGLLGSSLLDMGYIDEETLARVLSQHYRVPALAGIGIRPDQEALELLPALEADRLNLIPYRIESGHLEVLCLDPLDHQAFEELGRLTKLTPVPIIVPEARFSQVLLDAYGLERPQRFMTIQTRDFMAASFGESPGSVSERPIAESDFDKLYRRRDGFPAVSPAAPLEARAPKPEEAPSPAVQSTTAPAATAPAFLAAPTATAEAATEPAFLAAPTATAEAAGAEQVEQPEASAITFEEAERLLANVLDRDTIARVVLRVARANFKRVLLFTVHQKIALGWDGLGEGFTSSLVRKLAIPLDAPSVFKTVVDSRSPFFGALPNTSLNVQFLKDMGRLVPLSVLVVPVLVGSRVVNILYLDNGHRAHCQGDIGELLILAQRVSLSYEEMVERSRTAFCKGQRGKGQRGKPGP